MSDWTEGYVAGIDYTFGYFNDLNPLRAAVPLLNVGLMPPEIGAACELGFGHGFSANIHAAAAPQIRWYGTDFNPAHAGYARSLAAASAADARFFDQPFAEFCARTDLPDFDYVALHGVWSWISQDNQRIIVDFLRRKLKVGGVLYISYNTQPGFGPMVPLRRLMLQHIELAGGRDGGVAAQIDAALAFADRLVALGAGFAAANPTVAQRLAVMKQQGRAYLAHEYFNRNWHVVPFADVAAALAPARLTYACSAHYLDHLDALNLTPDHQGLLAEIRDPLFRQSVRDFLVNQQFRRDYWVKGARRLSTLEQTERVRALRVMLVADRRDITYTVAGALGPREMTAGAYEPVLEALGDYRQKTIGEIEQALSGAGMRLGTIYETILVLAGKGDVAPVLDDAVQQRAQASTDRLNAHVIDQARGAGDLLFLASPVTGGGVAVPRFDQLFLLALRQGRASAAELAGLAGEILGPQGQRVVKDGQPLASEEDNLAELTEQARGFLDGRLAPLQRLRIA